MKKFFTLFAGILLTLAAMAADRRPVVTVKNSKNFKVVIDGRSYFGNDITLRLDNFMGGRHTIKVYEMKRGYFGNRERLVDATSFQAGRNDVLIQIDWFGNIKIREMKNYRKNDRDDRHDRDFDRDNDRDDRPNRF